MQRLLVAEIKRVLNLVTRTWQTISHYLRWSWGRAAKPEPAGSTIEHACDAERQPMIKSRSRLPY
jgi:hypothetical protein